MFNEEDSGFISDIIKQSLMVSPEELPLEFHQAGASLPRWHLLMLKDRRRMEYYSEVIKPKVAGKVVLDVGTGSGILSHLALKWGAKKVYSVEENPALQAVYRHLMKIPLERGDAELISDDAKYLRLDQFSGGTPEVVVHELFGSIGMGENLIPIFRALKKEGILTQQTAIVPDLLEVLIRPVRSDVLEKESRIESFDDYPLNELNIFGSQDFWEQDYLASRASNWGITGESQTLFKCNLHELTLPESVELSFKASSSTHLQIWMNITDLNTGLSHSNDHQEQDTHWANAYLNIPFWLRGKAFKVKFFIHPNKIEVYSFHLN